MNRAATNGDAAAGDGPLLAPPDRVLSTLNPDGSRRWLRPRPSKGRFLNARRAVGYALIALFVGLPHVRADGAPAFLLDVVHRRFTLFGATFLPTDTLLLALLLVSAFLGVFWLTSLFGRVWCGFGCPQTVYLELLFRPLERLIEGKAARPGAVPAWRRVAKLLVFAALALVLAHTFLAWFVGADAVMRWTTGSPAEHPAGFALVAVTTSLVLADFGFMREQVCTLMCPYGRLQSVLLDRGSWIIGYDGKRGEPRGRLERGVPPATRRFGDCIDCRLCVATCPTGIDIRDGLQMECVACAQCVDACDAVMDQIGRPRGLIRYGSRASFEGGPPPRRARVFVYPVLIAAALLSLGLLVARRADVAAEFLRTRGAPYTVLADGRVSAPAALKLGNRGGEERVVELAIEGAELGPMERTIRLPAYESVTIPLTILVERGRFERGRAEIVLRVTGGERPLTLQHAVLGPLSFAGPAAPGTPAGVLDREEAR